jgi:hypothetical protein
MMVWMLGMTQDLAESRALEVLAWLVGQSDLLPVFLGASGVTGDDLRSRAGDPVFLAAVVDFILLDDTWVLACVADLGWRPEEIAALRCGLPGGDLPNWT